LKLIIQPFGNVPKEVLRNLAEDLGIFKAECQIKKPADIPMDAYNSRRQQYRSEILLSLCSRLDGDKILGITNVDLFAEPLNFVFGQAEIGGRASIISTARLPHPNQSVFRERIIKEAIHELGHTFGLVHCDNSRCVMYFSNSLADTDYKRKEYCKKCIDVMSRDWIPIQK